MVVKRLNRIAQFIDKVKHLKCAKNNLADAMSCMVLIRGKDTWIDTDVRDMCSKAGQDCYVLPDDNVIDASLDEPLVDKYFKVYSQRPHNSPQAPINSNYADC